MLKIAFADRAAASGDPDFINVPVERLTSKAYADERRRAIDSNRAQAWSAGVAQLESAHTTHMTAADAFGNVVASTQTINGLFGASTMIPGTGMLTNNYMYNLHSSRPRAVDRAGQARLHLDVADDGFARGADFAFALGLPGGLRIFPSALQAIVNVIDHGMSLQEAVRGAARLDGRRRARARGSVPRERR